MYRVGFALVLSDALSIPPNRTISRTRTLSDTLLSTNIVSFRVRIAAGLHFAAGTATPVEHLTALALRRLTVLCLIRLLDTVVKTVPAGVQEDGVTTPAVVCYAGCIRVSRTGVNFTGVYKTSHYVLTL